VLATRQVTGEPSPRVWLGFREDVSRDQLADWIGHQDIVALRAAMHEFEVRAGDAVFVRPGLLHATGAGVFLLEAQEPTDYSVTAEHMGYPIASEDAHLGLGWETMLDCFDRRAVSRADLQALRPRPTRVSGERGRTWLEEDLLGVQSHEFFRVHRLAVQGRLAWPHPGRFAILVVTQGSGVAETAHARLDLRSGDTCAILAGTAPTSIAGDMEVLVAMPSLGPEPAGPG
jgi:mannose-6-phosphate isomerase